MTYKDYFELTSGLVGELQGVKRVDQSSNCQQWVMDENYVSIVKLPNGTVVLLVYLGDRVESIVVGVATLPVEFPLPELTPGITANFEFIFKQLILPQKVIQHVNQNQLNDAENIIKPKPRENVRLESDSSPTFNKPNDMPDFDDELEINSKPSVSSQAYPSIGDSDLNPPGLPKHPSLKQWHDPLADNQPGGMHPSSSMFGEPNQGNTTRIGVPPGARFDDPYGEDSLQDIGRGLPSGLRHGGPGGFGGPPPGPPCSGFGGYGPGGSSGFGGGFV